MPTYRNKQIDHVIDVRSKLEFWLGHVKGAECIPVDRIEEALKERSDVSTSSRILVYCASGARSAAAMSMMQRLGYRHVVNGGAYHEVARELA
ncbi:MAG: rhodanese-like domain-containing protein [Proteobacteria bacterium]|nr:rhodanese-like domain-containing protein [Pseudomonadota bacterium]